MFDQLKRLPPMLMVLGLVSLVAYPFIGIAVFKLCKLLRADLYQIVSKFIAVSAVLLPLASLAMAVTTMLGSAHFSILQIAHTDGAGIAAVFYTWLYLADIGKASRAPGSSES